MAPRWRIVALTLALAPATGFLPGAARAQDPPAPPAAAAAPAPAAAPPAATAEERRARRVAALCAAWNTAKYLDPRLWESPLDWDAAFAAAALAVDGDAPTSAYRAVAERMLGALGDPATGVEAEAPEPAPPAAAAAPAPAAGEVVRSLAPGLVLLDVAAGARGSGFAKAPAALAAALADARGVVVDLRLRQDDSVYRAENGLGELTGQLVPHAVRKPASRWLVHWGYAPQEGATSGGYRSGLVTGHADSFEPAGKGGAWRVVFLLDGLSPLPDVAQALLADGSARLVSEKTMGEKDFVDRIPVPLGEGLVAQVRVEEVAGGPWPPVTVVAPPGKGVDPALAAARALLDGPWAAVPSAAASSAPASTGHRRENPYEEATLPDAGLRQLAGCRAWGVIHFFYPYLDLVGDWDGAYRASIPELAAAQSEQAYAAAVMRLMAHVADGHTSLWGHPGVEQIVGSALPALDVRPIDGQVVVTAVGDTVRAVAVGDVVTAVDGVPVEERMRRVAPFTAASTEPARALRLARRALAGAPGTTADVAVSGADGVVRRVALPRGAAAPPSAASGPIWRRLRPRVGYADLTRLLPSQVDRMLDELRDTDALVLDMRGYPNGVFEALGERLNVRGSKVGALFRRREVSAETVASPQEADAGFYFAQALPPPRSWTYRGKVLMLIDERAVSQAEHTCLFVEQSTPVTFVGSPTAGANGDVTTFVLPGGISVSFTGHDVRHADGRQLQRVGIQPDVPVVPTLAGVRAGRDEVLAAALAWLDAHPPARP